MSTAKQPATHKLSPGRERPTTGRAGTDSGVLALHPRASPKPTPDCNPPGQENQRNPSPFTTSGCCDRRVVG